MLPLPTPMAEAETPGNGGEDKVKRSSLMTETVNQPRRVPLCLSSSFLVTKSFLSLSHPPPSQTLRQKIEHLAINHTAAMNWP